MSSRKRPLSELIPSLQRAPARSAPTTPYTRRALEQRSAAKERSAKGRKSLHTGAQPLPLEGILRRLARATAPQALKSQLTPLNKDKENVEQQQQEEESDDDEDDGYISPRLMRFAGNMDEDDDDSELPTAPTPSVLYDDVKQGGRVPTVKTPAIDVVRKIPGTGRSASEKPRRGDSRVSLAYREAEEHEDDTMFTVEMGRRAVSEDPLDRYPRNSFGSIRMSDFAFNEQGRQSGKVANASAFLDDPIPDAAEDELSVDLTQGAETMELKNLRTEEEEVEDNIFDSPGGANDDEGTFLLQMPEAAEPDLLRPAISPSPKHPLKRSENTRDEDFDHVGIGSGEDAESVHALRDNSPSQIRKQTPLETVASRPRKKFKLTRHGTTIPSLPVSLIKHIAVDARTRVGKKKPVLGKDHVKALEQATEWFFEQVGSDLEAYSSHGRRKKRIIGDDVLTLMRRQRLCKKPGEMAKLAKAWLPKKVLEELDLPDEL